MLIDIGNTARGAVIVVPGARYTATRDGKNSEFVLDNGTDNGTPPHGVVR
jgi:hypothetical protein